MNKRRSIFFITLVTILLLNPAFSFTQNWIQGQTSADEEFHQEVWVNVDKDDYYSYEVFTKDGNIIIKILDEHQKVVTLDFCKSPNTLYFVDAYQNIIIAEERRPGATVAYWFITIVEKNDCFSLEAFSASSRIDNENYDISFGYSIDSIVEYDEECGNLYFSMTSWEDFSIYYVNMPKKTCIIQVVNWFNYNTKCQEDIIPGNSRVLVEANDNKFWIDSNNTRKNNTDPTIYYKKSISKYTCETIYQGGSKVFSLADWHFQYVSESSDHCKLTTFAVWGYVPEVSDSYTMTSSFPFKYFGDGYNFFIAISSNDVYLTNVYREGWGKYELWTGLLSKYCTDSKKRDAIYKDFNEALLIVFHNNQFYILTSTSFVVYGGCHSYFENVYEQKLTAAITCEDDLENVMQDYMNSCKGKWVAHNDNYGNMNKDNGYGNKDKDYGYGNKDNKDTGYGNNDKKHYKH